MHRWISAVAGSGKTTSLIGGRLTRGVRVLCLSFSRAALRKLHRCYTCETPNIHFSTIHGLAGSVLSSCNIFGSPILKELLWKTLFCECDDKRLLGELECVCPKWRQILELYGDLISALPISQEKPTIGDTVVCLARLYKNLEDRATLSIGIASYEGMLREASRHLESNSMTDPPDHILIDEAQDLTDLQWQFIEKVFQENPSATLNVVGDPNQIIYGFQGSGIYVWNKWFNWWKGLPGKKNYKVSARSYRCGKAILQVVNQIFAPKHESHRDTDSVVELSLAPLTGTQCMSKIIEVTNSLVDDGNSPEEILVLIKRRGVFSQALIAKFATHGIAVSGLSDDLSVELERIKPFFVVANSSLASDAVLLEILRELCHDCALYERVRQRSGSIYKMIEELYHDVFSLIEALREAKRDCGEFLSILGKHICLSDGLMDLAATYCVGQGHTADFIDYCRSQKLINVDPVPGHVRVLTIHGAKGLQARYVVLADTNESPHKISRDFYIKDDRLHLASPGNLPERRKIAVEESRTLLYVALTRAEKGVFLCGVGKIAKDSFADQVRGALEKSGATKHQSAFGEVLRLECS